MTQQALNDLSFGTDAFVPLGNYNSLTHSLTHSSGPYDSWTSMWHDILIHT